MKIRRILNPVAQENTYILENDTACLVIDPGSDTSAILAELKASDKPVAAILLTHKQEGNYKLDGLPQHS